MTLQTILFAPGAHGLQYEKDGTIDRVTMQSRLFKVKPGWKILLVRGIACVSSADISKQLLLAKRLGKSYSITFELDDASIQKKARRMQMQMSQLKRHQAGMVLKRMGT